MNKTHAFYGIPNGSNNDECWIIFETNFEVLSEWNLYLLCRIEFDIIMFNISVHECTVKLCEPMENSRIQKYYWESDITFYL